VLKQLKTSILSVVILGIFAGLVFPLVITAIAQTAFPRQANGSLIKRADGTVVGSELIAQGFTKPEYFHPRPSAAGNGYDATSSGGTNLGPTSDKLINGVHKKTADGKDDPSNFDGVKDLAAAYRKENGLSADAQVPADAVTRSASGLDPDISIENAYLQAARVAKARGMREEQVRALIDDHARGVRARLLGEPRVNVLQLNMALDDLASSQH
jgi:K+-transporting ATPase ATPase C chain